MTPTNNSWFRMYSDFMLDEKVELLTFEDQRHYVFILCMKTAGVLDKDYGQPGMLDRVVAKRLGLHGEAFESAKQRLIESGLIGDDWQPTAWDKHENKTKAESFVLPPWIPADTWAAFMEIRKGKKAKNTDYAMKLLVNTLTKLKAAGHDPVDIINTSIKSGWSDVYPPKLPASAMTPSRRAPAPEHFAARHYAGGLL